MSTIVKIMSGIRLLRPELAERARELLNEDAVRIKIVLKKIKDWLSLQPHLKVRLDDQWLVAFVRGCKYSLERVKEKIENLYTFKTLYSDLFRENRDLNDPTLNFFLHSGCIIPYVDKEDPAGPLFVFLRVEYDPVEYNYENLVKYAAMCTDVMLMEIDNLNISGSILIVDLEKVRFAHMAQLTFDLVRKALVTLYQGYPVRIKAAHFINPPFGFKMVLDLIKLFSSEKMRKRYIVHSTVEDLYEYVPKVNLPNEYGGSAGSLKDMNDNWITLMQKYREWLLDDVQYYMDEDLRQNKSKNDSTCILM